MTRLPSERFLMNGGNEDVVLVSDDEDMSFVSAPPNLSTGGGAPLRRISSPIVSPTSRSARPTARGAAPSQISLDTISSRPRSNPRNRTPMRYESPLNPNAFRESSPEQRREGQRISVRPFAGAAVGAAFISRRIVEERTGSARPGTPKSFKQVPSHRKIRRWNNDNFVGVAADIAKSSSRGAAIAETLILAQADAPRYRPVFNPQDAPPSALSSFIQDSAYEDVRQKFFSGEIGYGPMVKQPARKAEISSQSPTEMFHQIHERLRNVLVRACSNSEPSRQIVDAFEACLVYSFSKGGSKSLKGVVDTLLEEPTVTRRKLGLTTARFYFDSESSTGGFHRLLLHAVCHFHGLNAASSNIELDKMPVRLLTVTGKELAVQDIKLTDYIKMASDSCAASVRKMGQSRRQSFAHSRRKHD